MKPTSWLLALSLPLAAFVACETTPAPVPAATAATAATAASSTTTALAADSAVPEPTATATSEPTAEPTTSATAEPTAEPSAATTAATTTATPSATASAGGKKEFGCGSKGQKACPMQGWMKGVMAAAVSSGDAEKIASGLNTIASKPVAGFDQWAGIAAAGAAKAKAGDIDGAKESCKKCHTLYQKKYKETMRDQPW